MRPGQGGEPAKQTTDAATRARYAGRRRLPMDDEDPADAGEPPPRPHAPRRRLLVLPQHARFLRQVEEQMGLPQGPSFPPSLLAILSLLHDPHLTLINLL